MTSELAAQAFVWVHLPGQAEPVVCGRFTQRRTAGGAVGEFVYGRSYLARSQALAIDPVALPLQAQVFTASHLSGWFAVLLDAGPDAWGRRLIDRLHGPQDPLGYLLHARGQSVGALGFSIAADRPPEAAQPPAIASLERLLELHRAIEAGEPVAPEDHDLLLQGTSAGGARPKTTVGHEGALWLAKFPSAADRPDRPPVPVLEAALLSVAASCGIRVPRHRVVRVGDAPVLLVERFDRQPLGDGRYSRVAYASARTLLWSRPEVQQYSFMGSYSNLAHRMREWERAPQEDIRELYRRIAFNCLVGNTDDHDLNTGFLSTGDGFFALSPAFDLTCRPRTPRMFLALGFGRDGAAVTLENLLSEPQAYGYEVAEAAGMVREQWDTIHSAVMEQLLRHGCPERLAAQVCAAMPGAAWFPA
ncbi:type II toxin-antitoxin system HipA family toxin [Azohydromonas aeria]|uniref:type II toxin-antitoxin system HipA family toxin n=1 Tax=Azohydromonas aeria TaxID=2590212 RepID=UPI0012FB3B16|nr:type II toxin-antitoxin system HipA family toxin [Azohydromonas aeria]